MNKGSKIAILGSALAIVATLGYTAYAANSNSIAGQRENMLQGAVDNGIITEETKNNLETYNHEHMQNMMDETIKERLSSAVADETITQDEANEIQSWYDAKPESMSKLKGLGFGKMSRSENKGNNLNRVNQNIDTADTQTQ